MFIDKQTDLKIVHQKIYTKQTNMSLTAARRASGHCEQTRGVPLTDRKLLSLLIV